VTQSPVIVCYGRISLGTLTSSQNGRNMYKIWRVVRVRQQSKKNIAEITTTSISRTLLIVLHKYYTETSSSYCYPPRPPPDDRNNSTYVETVQIYNKNFDRSSSSSVDAISSYFFFRLPKRIG